MCRHQVPLHTIFSTKGFLANGTEPTHINSSGAECRLRKRKYVEHLHRISGHKIILFSSSTTPPLPPPPHFYCFPSSTTTATSLLISLHLHHHRHHHISIVLFHHQRHHHISIVFPPPPRPRHFCCFPSTRFYKRLPTAILSSFCSNVSCSEQQSWFSSTVS